MLLNENWDKGYGDPIGWPGIYPTNEEGYYIEVFETVSNQPEDEDQIYDKELVGGVYYKTYITGKYADGTYAVKENEDIEGLFYYFEDSTFESFKEYLEEETGFILGNKLTKDDEMYDVLIEYM